MVITGKLDAKTTARIEKLGRLNDRLTVALDTDDTDELLRLAAEYEMLGMHRKAREVRDEAG